MLMFEFTDTYIHPKKSYKLAINVDEITSLS